MVRLLRLKRKSDNYNFKEKEIATQLIINWVVFLWLFVGIKGILWYNNVGLICKEINR